MLRIVCIGPLPRSVTLVPYRLRVELMLKVPGPSSKYVPLGHAAKRLFMVDADVPAETVEPHLVRVGGVHGFGVVSPSGKVAGSPA